jgi:hypothetical protein
MKKGRGSLEITTVIDEYLAGVNEAQRAALQRLRKIIRAAAPQAEECLSSGLPAFRQNGPLVGFSASAGHCSFFPMSGHTVAAHQEELKGYDTIAGPTRGSPPPRANSTRGARPRATSRLLTSGNLRRRAGDQPRPGELADGAQPATGRVG